MNVNVFKKLKNWQETLVFGYLLAMFSIFLFFFRNYYFDITPAKYAFFQTATLILIGASMMLTCLLFICTKPKLTNIISALHDLSITDWGFLLMLGSHIITTFLAENPYESWSGSNGRQMGLLFTFLITSMYFLVSRWYRQEMSIIVVYLCSASLVTVLGIVNFFGYDPLQFSVLLSNFDIQRYLSTIGNITFFAHLICLSLPLSCVLFIHATHKNSKIIYGCFILSGFAGLFISNLDGAYLGMIAFFAFLLFDCLSSYHKMIKFIYITMLGLFTGKLLFILSLFLPDLGRGFATISYWIVSSNITTVALCLLTFIYIVAIRREDRFLKLPYARIAKSYLITLLVIIVIILSVFFYFSVIDTTSDIGVAQNYLRYNDDWGTGRGITWNRLIPLYQNDFSFLGKLFGNGLDSVRSLMVNNYTAGDIAAYDNAHNEYIQYLVTSGIVGLISYLILFISIQVRLYKHGKQDPLMIGILGCLIAHGMQAITGLNQPITTPLLFILIAMGECYLRSHKKDTQALDT